MARTARVFGILVKGEAEALAGLGATDPNLSVEPLFASIAAAPGQGLDTGARWWRIGIPPESETGRRLDADPGDTGAEFGWDACHRILSEDFPATEGIDFADPDLEQSWLWPGNERLGFAASCDSEPQRDLYPKGRQDFWHREDGYGQFASAVRQVPQNAPVRIAHLDTGFESAHATLPSRLRTELQRNFVEGGPIGDARDTSEGFFTQLGHGTATMALLAGGGRNGIPAIGAAPDAEVIPIRVANRVVLFRTSAIVKALDYVHRLRGESR